MGDDKLLKAAIIGVLSTIPSDIITQVLKLLGVVKYSNYETSSILILGNRPTMIVGIFVSFIVGGAGSCLLYLILKRDSTKNLVIKGMMASTLLWLLLEMAATFFFEDKVIPVRPISAKMGHLGGAIAYGVTVGILLKRYIFGKSISQLRT